MKEKLTRNIGLKILSIILAALLWILITNVDDPITTYSFANVKVDVLNENAIKALGQVYSITEGQTIDIKFAARRSVRADLAVSDFKVTADLSKLSDVNAVSIKITCPRYSDQVTILNNYQIMKVDLEKVASKQFKVNVVQKGNSPKGYYVYEKKTLTLLNVSGPKSKIDSISQIVVEVDVSNLEASYQIREKPKALDADGKEIDSSNLKFSEDSVLTNIGIYRTKKIDLKIIPTGSPAEGYIMTDKDYEPKTIEVAADNYILSKLDDLTVTEDITGATKDIEKEINLQEQLEEGVILVEESPTAVVNIKIEKADFKDISFMPGALEVRNKSSNLNLTYMTSGPIILRITGPADELKDISASDLKPYIDLSDYSAGLHTVDVKADLAGASRLANDPTVYISLV